MIGALNETVTLLARNATPDGGGGAAYDWAETASVPAGVEDLRSAVERAATRELRLSRRRFTIRRRAGLTHDARLVHDGTPFRVLSIRTLRKNPDYLEIDGEEIS